ncbi:MAG: hypothetical protein RAK22_02115, partial [Nanoarchaeota archaeon]|nr:hypothetical protein [Nanoarchaeota archaeon]
NGLVVSFFSVISVYVLFKHREDNAPMRMWGINLDRTRKQFILLIYAALLLIILFVPYILGFVWGDINTDFLLRITAEVIGTVSYMLVSIVMIWWTRGFMRFL